MTGNQIDDKKLERIRRVEERTEYGNTDDWAVRKGSQSDMETM